jgi:hypothetical protein
MSADQINDHTPEGTDQDQTPPAGGDNDQDQHGRETRQDRRDRQARERAAELETERDKLAGRLAAAQTREVERIAANTLEQPGDLLALSGHEIADFLDPETGEVDEGAVAAALDQLLESRPGLGKGMVRAGRNKYVDWGHSRDNRDGIGSEKTSWSDAFGSASSR